MLIAGSREKEGGTNEKVSKPEIQPTVGPRVKNPRRVAAGRINHAKRRGFTPAGLERLREAAHRVRPWERATGPVTEEGKSRSAQNSHSKRRAVREFVKLREEIRSLMAPAVEMRRIFQDWMTANS